MTGDGVSGGRLQVVHVIDSLAPGGAARSLAAVAPQLADGGVDLCVAYFHERPGVGPDLQAAGASLVRLHQRSRAGRAAAVRRLAADRRPDLVHTTLLEADLAGRVGARLAGVPVVSSLVSTPYGPEHRGEPGAHPWRLRGAQFADATTAHLVARWQANSRDAAEVMQERLHLDPTRIDVVHRGRDAERLGDRTAERRRGARDALAVVGAVPLILAVGRHERAKGLDVLIGAMPDVLLQVSDAHLVIVGFEGRETPTLRRLVGDLGTRAGAVQLVGHRENVADLLCAADVLVLPSRREGLPGTLIEALALRCPIVASDLPAVREVVGDTDPCARLVPPDDPSALAVAVVDVLRHPDAAAMAAGRRRFDEQFTIERAAEATIASYRRALER